MRISRHRRPPVDNKPKFRFNMMIRVPLVRVIGFNNEHLGEMRIEEAIARAQSEGHDLAEINPKAQPPICKIVDYGQFKYQKEKEERIKKQKQKAVEVKGVRISARISEHDQSVRLRQALKFMQRGDKVKIELILRGREQAHRELAEDAVHEFIAGLRKSAEITVEQEVKRQGNKITALVFGTVKPEAIQADSGEDDELPEPENQD